MRTFLRKYLMILATVVLALLVVLFFTLASVLPGLFSAPPAHDLLLMLHGNNTAKSALVTINLIVFELIQHTVVELIFLGVACGGIFSSTWVRSRTLLIASTVAILAYISYFTSEHFKDSMGWPLLLILLGLVFIAVSAIAISINKRYINTSNPNFS